MSRNKKNPDLFYVNYNVNPGSTNSNGVVVSAPLHKDILEGIQMANRPNIAIKNVDTFKLPKINTEHPWAMKKK